MFEDAISAKGGNMSANDVLSLNLHFEDWGKKRASSKLVGEDIDPFEYYCVDQFLKRYGLPDEEIISGITGGPNDGGVDAIYFLINRKLVDAETEIEAEGDMKINLEIFQVKQATDSVQHQLKSSISSPKICWTSPYPQ